MAALLQGQSVSQVAKEYKVPRGTVGRWSSELKEVRDSETFRNGKKERIGELLIAYLKTSLISMERQAEIMGDPEYLKSQSIADVALAHGIQTDKAIRILEALGGSNDE